MDSAIPFTRDFGMEWDEQRAWVEAARRGNIAAFEQLMRRHERLVLRVAQRILLNRETARDIAQEVFLRFHQNLRKLDKERDIKAWLCRTTTNLCIDLLRKPDAATLPLNLVLAQPAADDNPEQRLAGDEQRQLLLTALAQLAPKERAALVLRDLEGYPTSEVARILNSSEGTVRSQISIARNKLKDMVATALPKDKPTKDKPTKG